MLLMPLHGHVQVEHGFSTNKQVLEVNKQNETLKAQQIVYDHMVSENMKPQEFQTTNHLMELVKDA